MFVISLAEEPVQYFQRRITSFRDELSMTTLKQIVFHIGQTKTASTSLQFFLSWNKKNFFSHGVTYIDTSDTGKQISHRYIFNLLMLHNSQQEEQKNRHKEELQKIFLTSAEGIIDTSEEFLIDSLKSCPTETGLISEELFWHFGEFDRKLRLCCLNRLKVFLRKAVPGVRIRIIAYLRPQDCWLESWHNQLIKDAYMQGAVRQVYLRHKRLDAYNYCQIIDDWVNVLEPEEVIIRPFVPSGLRNNSIYDDFLVHGLGLAPSPDYLLPRKKLQASLHPAVCAYVIRNKPSPSGGYKEALQEMSVYAKQYRPFKNIQFTLLGDVERRGLYRKISKGNMDLSERFNLACDLSDFFTWGRTTVPSPLPRRLRKQFQNILGQHRDRPLTGRHERFNLAG